MKTLIEFDEDYNQSLIKTYDQLEYTYDNITENYQFDLTKTEISEAILKRLYTYYQTQTNIKNLLDKRYLTAASDFFVESLLFFIKLYLNSNNNGLSAHSERQISRTRNAIRPDISIWRKDEVVAIIECKTQLGWNRDNWEQQYDLRDKILKSNFPKAKSYLVVMTGSNWSGFGNSNKLNDVFFCLLNNIWPIEFATNSQIMTPIEGLFKQLQ